MQAFPLINPFLKDKKEYITSHGFSAFKELAYHSKRCKQARHKALSKLQSLF